MDTVCSKFASIPLTIPASGGINGEDEVAAGIGRVGMGNTRRSEKRSRDETQGERRKEGESVEATS